MDREILLTALDLAAQQVRMLVNLGIESSDTWPLELGSNERGRMISRYLNGGVESYEQAKDALGIKSIQELHTV